MTLKRCDKCSGTIRAYHDGEICQMCGKFFLTEIEPVRPMPPKCQCHREDKAKPVVKSDEAIRPFLNDIRTMRLNGDSWATVTKLVSQVVKTKLKVSAIIRSYCKLTGEKA